jgi:hypothetical protein
VRQCSGMSPGLPRESWTPPAAERDTTMLGTRGDAPVYPFSCWKGGRALLRHRAWIVSAVVVAALTYAGVALSKEGVTTTTCGRDRCRTVTNGISGIAALPGRVSAPRNGRFYTVSLRTEINGRPEGWKIDYEAKAPDRPRARRPRPLVHGHPLGATHTRCATALLGSDPRPNADAIGTPHASLKARQQASVGWASVRECHQTDRCISLVSELGKRLRPRVHGEASPAQ